MEYISSSLKTPDASLFIWFFIVTLLPHLAFVCPPPPKSSSSVCHENSLRNMKMWALRMCTHLGRTSWLQG